MIEWVLIIVLLIALLLLFWHYSALKGEIESRARAIAEVWRATELETRATEKAELLLKEWMLKDEKRIREDAIQKSEAVIRGKITEHLIPFFPDFTYNPKDARFLGTPVDLVIFDGLSDGDVRRVVFLEVKTGKAASLSTRERQVRDCIEARKVAYEVLRHEEPSRPELEQGR
jgi:predicted Holliday junction resolvase-like endonuclease